MMKFSCELPANFQSLKSLRELLQRYEAESSNGLKRFSQIELALIEIFTNIVKHGEVIKDDLIEVQLRSSGNEMNIQLIDNGKQFLPSILETVMPSISQDIDLLPENGFGVPLVVSITDSVRYERKDEKNFTTLIFVLDEDS